MRPDPPAKSPTPETSAPPSPRPQAAPAAPATRPKLNLAKRTVSEAQPDASAGATDSKASPFGAARPVDTATKEKEIEEKRQIAIREKREADEKEKAAKAEEKKLLKEKNDQEAATPTSPRLTKERSGSNKENSEEAPQQPKYDILRRVDSATNDMVADEEDETEAQLPVDDKAVKPKEVVVDTPAQANGTWRNGSGKKQPETTTEVLEEDGWSTVSKPNKQRNNRRGNAPRALAS
jgi:translation initiation factor 4B